MTEPLPLADYRAEHDLTLEQAGARFGVNKTTFMRWEDGRVPSERAVEIERVTGIPRWRLRPDLWDKPPDDAAAPASAPRPPKPLPPEGAARQPAQTEAAA